MGRLNVNAENQGEQIGTPPATAAERVVNLLKKKKKKKVSSLNVS